MMVYLFGILQIFFSVNYYITIGQLIGRDFYFAKCRYDRQNDFIRIKRSTW